MTASERRLHIRVAPSTRTSPVSCQLVVGDQSTDVQILNYHYRGASLKIQPASAKPSEENAFLRFKLGEKFLPEKIKFRVVWENTEIDGTFGVEFYAEAAYVLARAERFFTHSVNAPVVTANDPLDPNRRIYFKVLNISTTGMLIETSLSNKHVFPGMELKNAEINFSGMGSTNIDLYIENSRSAEQKVNFGVSLNPSDKFQQLASKYLANLGSAENSDDRIDRLVSAGFAHRDLKDHLSIREVTSPSEYEQVLKLRFEGYRRAGKTRESQSWQQMGEGREEEGMILGGYLGGQLIASVELRFSRKKTLRLSEKVDVQTVPELRGRDHVEINKLVVHPSAQKTDVVVGLFQKIHAVTMVNGKPDGLMMAEDRLVPLYERLGARKINLNFEHPTKPNTRLHVMILPRETYEDGSSINPLAWSMIYENTHQYLNELGLAKRRLLRPHEKAIKWISKRILALKRSHADKSGQRKDPVRKIAQREMSSTTIDPRWTKQHLHTSVMLPYLIVADELIGNESVEKILKKIGIERRYFNAPTNWFSVDFFDTFIEEFGLVGDVNELQKLSGYRNFSKEVLGINHFLLKHFLTPMAAFNAFGGYMPKFNKTRTYEIIDSGTGFCRLRIGLKDKSLKPRDISAKYNWLAILDAHVLVITGKSAKISQSKSIFDGDPYCEYLIEWQQPLATFRNFCLLLSISGLTYKAISLLLKNFSGEITALMVAISATTVSVFYFWLKNRTSSRRYIDMVNSLGRLQTDSEDRYQELQNSKHSLEISYQEGKLLETISREIQNSDDLTKILDTSITAVCDKFSFQRAFVMIADAERKYLRTAALRGAGQASEDLWDFKVDVSTIRENPLVLSSSYHSGQSILVSNVDEHKFHLNDSSKMLIERLKTSGFAIVPIPSEKGCWGVMVADKEHSADPISRRDLVALQRVCQSLGIALDKKAKIENEVRIRNIFQKYVPSSIVESTLNHQEPRLGGETRNAICLFLDIRNFTMISEQLPSEILVGLLNQIWDLLQQTVKESGGLIDKFLGDGALVTWGSVPGQPPDPAKVINSAMAFLNRLEHWNMKMINAGIPKFDVGIGIHSGPVIAGNVGSLERMEFTVIGPTVNVASRLEQLNKKYQSHIVISEAVTEFAELNEQWLIQSDVQVRGVNRTMKVATFAHNGLKVLIKESA